MYQYLPAFWGQVRYLTIGIRLVLPDVSEF
jgi:hypothetical protein